jgi:hypothetical protein
LLGYGAAAQGWEFADANTALTNGVRLFYVDNKGAEIEIGNYKNNTDFMRASLRDGISIDNWEARGFGTVGDYGFLISIDLTQLMPPYGVKLDRGTQQKMTITIRDDCTDADTFNCKAFGFERFE